MSSGKIIQINPDLFQISKKTRKNRQDKDKERSKISIPKPVIGASSIKRKLLNRIKQKKMEETKEAKKSILPKKINDEDMSDDEEDDDMNDKHVDDEDEDELSSAMNYLDSVSKREKEREKILAKTYKNRGGKNNSVIEHVSLNIPYQLTSSTETNKSDVNSVVNNILDDWPYGCLKGGTKPTYRTWINSVKKYSNMSSTDYVRPPTPPKRFKEREREREKENNFTDDEYKESLFNEPDNYKELILKKQIDDKLKKIENEQKKIDDMDDDIEASGGNNVSDKKYVKKIIKRKYTLGKSCKYRKVGVLIKGRQTKKNIINSHKKIKQTDIHQIKKYLKKHGMLKTGSSCPDEILRKMYESAVLSGEINNTNKNTLIHNFLNDDEIK